MDLTRHTDLLDRLACSYALGTLRAGARRRFESMAREHASVRAAALLWQTRVASLTELQVQHAPDTAVWLRIERLLRAEQHNPIRPDTAHRDTGRSTRPSQTWWASLGWWRGATAMGVCTTLLAVGISWSLVGQRNADVARLQAQLQAVPQDAYVAVLHDDKSKASMLVTFDPRNKRLTLQRLGSYQESSDRSLQLWAIPPGGAPRSLGVLPRDKVLRLAAAEAEVRDASALAISLEPRGGVPGAAGPTGPVLFSGTLIQKLP